MTEPTMTDVPDEQMTSVEDDADRSMEDLKAEIGRLRKEAASRRVANREKEAELDEYRKWKDAQKTEQERLQERLSKAEADLMNYQRKELQEKAAKEAGLSKKLAHRVRGNSYEEMVEDARELTKDLGVKEQEQVSNIFNSSRGEPVRSQPSVNDQGNNWLRNA